MEPTTKMHRVLNSKINRRKMLQAMAGATGLGAGVQLAGRGRDSAAGSTPGEERGSLLLAHRVAAAHWREDAQFALLLKVLRTYRRAVDEIALCTDYGHWPPLMQIGRGNEILKRRIEQLKEADWPTGINVIWTLGHGDTNDPLMPPLPFQPTVGHNGQVSNRCPCPNDPRYHAYISNKYELMARTNPDFIWVDDDLRASHHGPVYPCFCPICLKLFDHGMNRAELVNQLNTPSNADLRLAWTQFMADSINRVCADIHSAIVKANPSIEIGEMTIGYSHSTYAGYPIHRWMKTLGACRGRPGHGYYTDEVSRTLLMYKAINVGREVRDYPQEVSNIQYELETYPHIPLQKASRTVIDECTAALMMGCNGIAFFLFPGTNLVSFEDYDRVLNEVNLERSTWEMFLKRVATLPLVGFWPADNRMLMANRQVGTKGWFWEKGVYDIQQPNEMVEMGLPLTTYPDAACGILFPGKVAEAFRTEELRGFLARGVYMDSFALDVFWARGLGGLTGVKPGERIPGGVIERLTDHPFNGPYAGDCRNVLAGPSDGVCSLVPIAKGVGGLARLVRSDGTDAGCCFSTYTNALGGRVAVSSYGPWHRQGRSATRHRLLAVANWLSKGRLPVSVEQTMRIAPLVRMSSDGKRFVLLLLNAGLDSSGPLTLRVRAQPRQVSLIKHGRVTALGFARKEKATVVRLPSMPAWHTAIVLGS